MTTQEFLSQFSEGLFSESTMSEMMNIVGTTTEISPEMAAQLAELLEREIDNDLKDIPVDTVEAQALEAKVEAELKELEEDMNTSYATMEQNLSELVDMSKKVDVLERLHSQ